MSRLCAHCGFDNDPTRIFCQNCGTRLEEATPESGKLFIPPGQQAPAAVRKPIKPVSVASSRSGKSVGGALFSFLVSTLLSAALLAAVIQMARTPNDVPPAVPANDAQASALYADAEAASQSAYPRNLGFAAPQINNYLATRLLPAESAGGSFIQRKFSRAFVTLGEGSYRLTAEQKISSFPLYISLIQKPVSAGGKVTLENIGGAIGRLPIHPALAPLLERLTGPMADQLMDAQALFANASSMEVQPSLVIVNWPGTTRHP